MKNFLQPGEVLTFTAPGGGVLSGVPLLIGALLVVPGADAAAGASFEGRCVGVFGLPKTSAQAWAEGDAIYFDSVSAKCDNTGAIGVLVGVATAVAANPSSTGNVKLNGTAAESNSPVLPTATVAATGSIQGDAAQLADGFALVSAADGTKGVKLPVAAAGKRVTIKNNVNAVLKVWPSTGNAVNAIAANSSLSMAALTSAEFTAFDATTWFTNPLVPS